MGEIYKTKAGKTTSIIITQNHQTQKQRLDSTRLDWTRVDSTRASSFVSLSRAFLQVFGNVWRICLAMLASFFEISPLPPTTPRTPYHPKGSFIGIYTSVGPCVNAWSEWVLSVLVLSLAFVNANLDRRRYMQRYFVQFGSVLVDVDRLFRVIQIYVDRYIKIDVDRMCCVLLSLLICV